MQFFLQGTRRSDVSRLNPLRKGQNDFEKSPMIFQFPLCTIDDRDRCIRNGYRFEKVRACAIFPKLHSAGGKMHDYVLRCYLHQSLAVNQYYRILINHYRSLYRLRLLFGGRENLPNFSSSPSAFCFRTVTGSRGRRASRAATSLAPPSTVDEAPAAEYYYFHSWIITRF